MKPSELNYLENKKHCVWVKWKGIEFYWEKPSNELVIIGDSYDQKIYISGALSIEPKAIDAKKAITKWLTEAFGV